MRNAEWQVNYSFLSLSLHFMQSKSIKTALSVLTVLFFDKGALLYGQNTAEQRPFTRDSAFRIQSFVPHLEQKRSPCLVVKPQFGQIAPFGCIARVYPVLRARCRRVSR